MELIGGWGNNHAAIESNSTKEYKGRVRRFDIDIRFGQLNIARNCVFLKAKWCDDILFL